MRKKVLRMTLTTSQATFIEKTILFDGEVAQIVLVVPALDGSNTAKFIINDGDTGEEIFSEASLAESTTHTIDLKRDTEHGLFLSREVTFRIETSGAQTSNRDFTTLIFYK